MNPLDFRQESPPTRQGRRAIGGLILKAGLLGPKEEPVASTPKIATQTSMPATHQMSLPLEHTTSVPTSKPKTTGPQLSIPGTESHQQHLPGTGEPSKIASPSTPQPATGGVVISGPQSRPGAKISPATVTGGASARTPEEHQALQGKLTPPTSKPQAQYGKKMTQVAKPGKQMNIPEVAVHQQAMRAGAGHQLELPGGAVMHTPIKKEPASRAPETIGQATERHRQTFGSTPSQVTRPGDIQELHAAASAKPMQAEGGQMLLPGTAASSRRAQQQAGQQLQTQQSAQAREQVQPGQQMELGPLVTQERGPATEAGKVGQTMRMGTPEERRTAIKQSAAGMRQRAEASGRQAVQQPVASQQPGFTPVKSKQDPHGNLSQYHNQMAAHHEYQHQQTGDQKHLDAATAHREAATGNAGASMQGPQAARATAYGQSHKAEQLSQAAGVTGGLSQRLGKDQPAASKFAAEVAGGGERGTSTGGGQGTSTGGNTMTGIGSRGGRPVKGTATYGVASPNILGNYASGYGLGLAAGQLGGPMFQTAQLVQQGAGKLHSLASNRQRFLTPAQREQARDVQTAAHQRQQQLQQMYQVANKAMIESTPPVRSGTRRPG